MKKVLFATTALIATAGVAAADITVGGNGRMGIVNDQLRSEANAALSDTFFSSRIRITFAASGESDNGLSFGGAIRADNAGDGAAGRAGNVFILGGFGRLSMGDVSSAAENAVGDLAEVGYTGISAFGFAAAIDPVLNQIGGLGNEMIYLTSVDTTVLLYSYTVDALSVFASVGQPGDDLTTWSLGAAFTAGDVRLAIGHEDAEDTGSHTIVSATATLGDLALEAIYGSADFDTAVRTEIADESDLDVVPTADLVQWGLGVTYTMGDTRADAFYRTTDVIGLGDVDAIGVGLTHALGGGAAVEGGIAQVDIGDEDFTRFDLGMTFSF